MKWLDWSQRLSYALFGAAALLGLVFVYYRVSEGDVFSAVIGGVVACGAIAMGLGLRCIVQLAARSDVQAEAFSELRRRADAMEALTEQLYPMPDLAELGSGDPSSLVAARTDRDAYPRLADEELDHASNEPLTPDDLRAAFRNAVYERDYAEALAVGRRIEALLPESPMAEQFRSLRRSLESKAS